MWQMLLQHCWGSTCTHVRNCNFAGVVLLEKMRHSRPLFLYFRLFNTVDSKQMLDKSLPMTGFELQISGFGGNRSTNWAKTTAPLCQPLKPLLKSLYDFFGPKPLWPLSDGQNRSAQVRGSSDFLSQNWLFVKVILCLLQCQCHLSLGWRNNLSLIKFSSLHWGMKLILKW